MLWTIKIQGNLPVYSEMISLNYPSGNVLLYVKFILESNSSRTSISGQAQTQAPIILWCQIAIYPKAYKEFYQGDMYTKHFLCPGMIRNYLTVMKIVDISNLKNNSFKLSSLHSCTTSAELKGVQSNI